MAQEVDPDKTPDGKRSLSYKVKVLDVLRRNSYNYALTFRETGVPVNTIRYWEFRHGPTVRDVLEGEVAVAEVVVDSLTKMEVTQNKFMDKAIRVKLKALDKIDAMIAKEKSMRNLIDTVKILHLITNPEVNTSQLSPYEEVFTKFLIEGPKSLPNGKKSNQPADPGDTEE
jgi:hypothetical protein